MTVARISGGAIGDLPFCPYSDIYLFEDRAGGDRRHRKETLVPEETQVTRRGSSRRALSPRSLTPRIHRFLAATPSWVSGFAHAIPSAGRPGTGARGRTRTST